MLEILKEPWPWYVVGPLVGLTVPALLILGNKSFGLSSSLRHACAACFPGKVPFFQYDWKKEIWNLIFILGIFLGGLISLFFLKDPNPVNIHPNLQEELAGYGITDLKNLVPLELINWESLFTIRGFFLMVVGGFLIGFGARYAGGCTSGHSIMGLSNLQWPSLVATIGFMLGGFIMANLILPVILSI